MIPREIISPWGILVWISGSQREGYMSLHLCSCQYTEAGDCTPRHVVNIHSHKNSSLRDSRFFCSQKVTFHFLFIQKGLSAQVPRGQRNRVSTLLVSEGFRQPRGRQFCPQSLTAGWQLLLLCEPAILAKVTLSHLGFRQVSYQPSLLPVCWLATSLFCTA